MLFNLVQSQSLNRFKTFIVYLCTSSEIEVSDLRNLMMHKNDSQETHAKQTRSKIEKEIFRRQ